MAGSTVTAVTFPRDAGLGPTTVKRGLKGAAGGLYVGPIIGAASVIEGPSSPTHAVTALAGGVEDTTGYRESDTYDRSGNSGGLLGAASTSVSRPTGRTAYIGNGVQGGSTAGDPIDSAGRAEDTGVDRFGRSLTGANYPTGGGGRFTYTNFDGRAVPGGDGGLGGGGRGTTVDGETVTANQGVPATHDTAESSGTVAVVDAAGKIVTAIHANDITGGSNGHKGAEITVYKRGSDTDDDGAFYRAATIGTVVSDGPDDTDTFTAVTAGTYSFYVRWRYAAADGSIHLGPASARGTVTVS